LKIDKILEVAKLGVATVLAVIGAVFYALSVPASLIGGGLVAWSSYVAGEGVLMAVSMFIIGTSAYGVGIFVLAAILAAIAVRLVD